MSKRGALAGPGNTLAVLDVEQRAVHHAQDQRRVRGQELVRLPVERETRVRAVIHVGPHDRATANDETTQRPVALTHRESARTGVVELVQRADDALEVQVSNPLPAS